MNIPLDRLYCYIQNIAKEIYGDRVIIYRFWPHGSKNITDLNNLNEENNESLGENEWCKKTISPLVWCNDQEPLDYEFYKTNTRTLTGSWIAILKSINQFTPAKNLNYNQSSVFKKNLLLHSEKRSPNLENYQIDGELIPVYYWSHAVIARDWFRYAEHETFQRQSKKKFLIYNRAWSGTREYRLKFAEYLIRLGLPEHCQISISPIEPELDIHYDLHTFKNPVWRPQTVLENFFPVGNAQSHYSADFDTNDYNSTDIEVVLETLFDDSRLHLTEKSLRPIACGQPFILAGTQGSLEYLRSYGFKTFGMIWDERYDECADPEERLARIADLMKQIANWGTWIREQKMAEARAIADYNRRHFFSKEFFSQVVDELKENLNVAFAEFSNHTDHSQWIRRWNELLTQPAVVDFLETNQDTKAPTKTQVDLIFAKIKSLGAI
jgi:hypothetical protein